MRFCALVRRAARPYIERMRQFLLTALIALSLAAPLRADEAPEEPPASSFAEMMERMLRGFMEEIEPQMREFERGFQALEPQVQRFLDEMRDMTQYHPPEMLPNGDILIRRRQADASEDAPPEPEPEAEPQPAPTPFEL